VGECMDNKGVGGWVGGREGGKEDVPVFALRSSRIVGAPNGKGGSEGGSEGGKEGGRKAIIKIKLRHQKST